MPVSPGLLVRFKAAGGLMMCESEKLARKTVRSHRIQMDSPDVLVVEVVIYN